MKLKFEEAISVPESERRSVADSIDFHTIEVEPQYTGARIEGDVVTLDFVKKMMEDFKNQKYLHKRYAFQIVLQTRELLQALPSLVDINVPNGSRFTVCGDVHGQFYDLLNIFELNGLPSEENPYLFNGDFVDRGSFSLEVILTLFAFKCMSPSGEPCSDILGLRLCTGLCSYNASDSITLANCQFLTGILWVYI
ncbi:hypothetical protein SLEP1_g50827 [Rubroshorea leprosula]|nr:hypothetical protein SLEP1_g50827 [Rubroshorea leprosula]